MIYKSTSIKEVISKVYRDLNLQIDDRWQDMIEWAGEAIEHIGSYYQFEKRIEKLEVNDYRAPVPCGFHKLVDISFNGRPLLPLTGSFDTAMCSKELTESYRRYGTPRSQGSGVSNATNYGYSLNPGFFSFNFEKSSSVVSVCDHGYTHLDTNAPCGCFTTTTLGVDPYDCAQDASEGVAPSEATPILYDSPFKPVPISSSAGGGVFIAYMRIPLDEDFFPLIPDDVSYKEAVYRYIVYKLHYPRMLAGNIPMGIYQDMEKQWRMYCGQARAEANMPDVKRMESIKRIMTSLIPHVNRADNFFTDLNVPSNSRYTNF